MGILKSLLLLSVFVVIGCSSSKLTTEPMQEMTNEEKIRSNELFEGSPIWVSSPLVDDNEYIYSTAQATGNSLSQQMTMMNAENLARQAMAQKIQTKVEALQKSFQETVTSADAQNYDATFTNVNKQTASQALTGSQAVRTRCIPLDMKDRPTSNVNQRCYVIMRMGVNAARDVYENALSREQELYVKFKASKAYDELNKEF